MTRIARTDLPLGDGHAPLSLFTVTGARPGPVLAVIGCIHGDEYEGPLALSALLAEAPGLDLAGTLILLPLANRDAAAAGSRVSASDGLNLARVFPGDPAGSYSRRLADLIHRHVITPADAVLDLHSGGTALASTFFAGYLDDADGIGARARAMALDFGAPHVWRHELPQPPGRTMTSCHVLGKPGIYVEVSGGRHPAPEVVAAYHSGVRGVMAGLGMIGGRVADGAAPPPRFVVGSGDLDLTGPSPATGLCTAHATAGDWVAAGRLLFTISDLDGSLLAEVRAPSAGLLMFTRRSRWVEKDETLLALAVADPAEV